MEENPAERIIQWVPKPPAMINREPSASFSAHHKHITAHQPQSRTPASTKPMSTALMGGSGLTGTVATLRRATLLVPSMCGKLKVISPPSSLVPLDRPLHHHAFRHHSSAAVTCHLKHSIHHLSVLGSDRAHSPRLSCSVWWTQRIYEEHLRPDSPPSVPACVCVCVC